MAFALSLAVAALVLSGCSDPLAPLPLELADSRAPAIDAAIRRYATVYCEAHSRCEPQAFDDFFGDVPTCVDRSSIHLVRTRFAEGSNTTVADVEACTDAVDFSTCARFQSLRTERTFPEECYVPGSYPAGAACLYDRQCESLFCRIAPPYNGCGTCSEKVPLHGTCDQSAACPPSAACDGVRCVPFVDRGEPCGPEVALCHVADACKDGVCRARGEQGEPCETPYSAFECTLTPHQLACHAETLTCEPLLTHSISEPCATLEDGATANCEHGLKCIFEPDPGEAFGEYRCAPPRGDGDDCRVSAAYAGACIAPAYCFHGICRIPDASLCEAPPVPP